MGTFDSARSINSRSVAKQKAKKLSVTNMKSRCALFVGVGAVVLIIFVYSERESLLFNVPFNRSIISHRQRNAYFDEAAQCM